MSDRSADVRFGRPVVWVLAAMALFPVVALLSRLIGRLLSLATVPRQLVGEGLLLAGTLTILAMSGWWRQSGLVARWRSQGWVLVLVVFVGLGWLLSTPALLTRAIWARLPQTVLVVALVGFNEETLFRGVVLHGLRSRGPLVAGLISSLVFGLLHLPNLLSIHQLSFVVLESFNAALIGLLFAALRLRMISLWPLIVTHALWDLPGILFGFPPPDPPPITLATLILDLVLLMPFALFGLGLLIHQTVRRPKVATWMLSGDGRWWWNGSQWISTRSADGRWRWDGAAWIPLQAAPDEPDRV
jgi:uncharacterized protein